MQRRAVPRGTAPHRNTPHPVFKNLYSAQSSVDVFNANTVSVLIT